jgi:hypothetical protein
MKFYQIDGALEYAVDSGGKKARIKIEIDFGKSGVCYPVFEKDILQADFYGLKEVAGGVSARGEILLDNQDGLYSDNGRCAGAAVKVYFTAGEGLAWFHRFTMHMSLPAASGGLSCKCSFIYEARSARKLFNCGVYYHISLVLPNPTAASGGVLNPTANKRKGHTGYSRSRKAAYE